MGFFVHHISAQPNPGNCNVLRNPSYEGPCHPMGLDAGGSLFARHPQRTKLDAEPFVERKSNRLGRSLNPFGRPTQSTDLIERPCGPLGCDGSKYLLSYSGKSNKIINCDKSMCFMFNFTLCAGSGFLCLFVGSRFWPSTGGWTCFWIACPSL